MWSKLKTKKEEARGSEPPLLVHVKCFLSVTLSGKINLETQIKP